MGDDDPPFPFGDSKRRAAMRAAIERSWVDPTGIGGQITSNDVADRVTRAADTAVKKHHRERKVRAQNSPKRDKTKKWQRAAAPVLRKLREEHPDWGAKELRGTLRSQWTTAVAKFLVDNPKLAANPPKLPQVRAIDDHIKKYYLSHGEAP